MGRSAIVLAAGFGTRMKSKLHKVLHPVCGKPMILHILDELAKLQLDQIIVVVGQQREAVIDVVQGRAEIAIQDEQLGTGHAVQVAVPLLRPDSDTTVVLYGDAPLIRAETINRLMTLRQQERAPAVVLTAKVSDPTGLGRVFIGADQHVERIVEEKDATPEERQHTVINTGIYAFHTEDMKQALSQLRPDNAQAEYYLTDTLTILRSDGKQSSVMDVDDADEIASVNDRVQLAQVEQIYRMRILRSWMQRGVTLMDPQTTYISADVQIGQDTVIYPGTFLEGCTTVGEDCKLGPNVRLVDATIEDGAELQNSVVLSSLVGQNATVGPFAYLRPGTKIGSRVKIGDFVEVKNSTIDDDAKVSHLAYVGDATIGKRVNVGCGVITVNYDGKEKHRTMVGDDSFIGSNVNLIAPVTVGTGAYVCAGSTITDEVPDDGFAIGRPKQITKPQYVKQWRAKRVNGTGTRGTNNDGDRG